MLQFLDTVQYIINNKNLKGRKGELA